MKGHSDRLRGRTGQNEVLCPSRIYIGWEGMNRVSSAWEKRDREQTRVFKSVLCVLHLFLSRRFGASWD